MSLKIVWDTYEGLTIRDIHQKWRQRIIDFMIKRKFKENPLFVHLGMGGDDEEIDSYKIYLNHILNDECSVVALNEETDEILAVALVKWMTKEWRSWTALRVYMKADTLFTEFVKLRIQLFAQHCKKYFDQPFDSLHLFELYVDNELKLNLDFLSKLFDAVCEVGRHMKMPRITYSAISSEEQSIAQHVGLNERNRIIYSLYHVQDKGRIFVTLRDFEQMHASLYDTEVDKLIPFEEMTIFEPEPIDEDEIKRKPDECIEDIEDSLDEDIYVPQDQDLDFEEEMDFEEEEEWEGEILDLNVDEDFDDDW